MCKEDLTHLLHQYKAKERSLVIGKEHVSSIEDLYAVLRQKIQRNEDKEECQKRVLSLFLNPDIFFLYVEFGKKIYNKNFDTIYTNAIKRGLYQNDFSPCYFFSNKKVAIGALLSTFFGTCVGKVFSVPPYDPRGKLENCSGLLSQEVLEQGQEVTTFFTPTITLGNEPAPEALCLLDAIKEKSPHVPYDGWVYINLQNRAAVDEGPRAEAIMELGKHYNDQFFPLSLSVDDSFYRPSEKEDKKPLDEAYMQYAQQHTGCSYVEQIYDFVKERVKGCEQRIVFREIIQLVLIRQHLLEVAKKKKKLLFSVVCKEGMDRAGNKNSALLWALSKEMTEEKEKEIISFLHARALFCRFRLVKRERVEPFLALMRNLKHNEIHAFFKEAALL